MRSRLKRLEGRGQAKAVELWIAEGTSDVYEYQATIGGPVQQATIEELNDPMGNLRRVVRVLINGVITDEDEYPEELV